MNIVEQIVTVITSDHMEDIHVIPLVLQIYGVFYRDPEIGFKLFFLTDSCSQDLALQESE